VSDHLPDALVPSVSGDAAGLTSEEAARRLAAGGPNVLRVRTRLTLPRLVASRFRNPLIVLLVAASVIAAFSGDITSAVVVMVVVAMSVSLDTVQEYRAGRAAERLRESVATRATVWRDGARHDILASEVVPGDVVLLAAGDLVPADGSVLEERDLFVNEAALTGEAFPVEKHAATGTSDLFLGTSVVSGSSRMLVRATGRATALGKIGATLEERPPATAFEVGTRHFGLLVLRLAVLMVLFVILVNIVRGRPGLESFLFAVALAVGLTPELLPMIVTVTLSRGALRMSNKKVIVKRLASIHDLGSIDVLCTDKTGTLTEGTIRLDRHLDPLGRSSLRVLELAYLNSSFQSGLRSPLDDAILAHQEIDAAGWRKVDEVPFDFERRRVSVLLDKEETRLLVVKGAVEDVLRNSTRFEADGPKSLNGLEEPARVELAARGDSLARDGYRVLGVAWRSLPADRAHCGLGDERDLVFAGFAAFEDPPKASATGTLAALSSHAVALKILTGDNELVTRHVCAKIGLPIQGLMTGTDVDALDDAALERAAPHVNLFCRFTPPQKNRVILALKRGGHIVGYLGDGINDAPSLHSADVGISVDSGADVAKAAADMVLLERDLGVLYDGVLEGRRTFGNIMKYVMMAMSSNFGNMLSMALASLVLPFLPMLPTQILLNNFLYDVSEIPIPMDTVDDDYLRRPHRWDMRFVRNFMLTVGPVSSAFDFLTFFILLRVFHAGAALFHTGWFIESLATQVFVIFVIRTRGSPLASRPSRLLILTSLAVVAVALLLPFTSAASRLGFVPAPGTFFVILAIMVGMYLVLVELVKRWFYERFAPG